MKGWDFIIVTLLRRGKNKNALTGQSTHRRFSFSACECATVVDTVDW